MKFYKCPICGNIIYVVEGKITPVRCCGREMEELIPNTTEAAFEKHLPVYQKEEDKIKVTVGEVEHPMTSDHYITFIAQVADNKINMIKLTANDKPTAVFPYIKDSKLYEYCNLHGLWVSKVE